MRRYLNEIDVMPKKSIQTPDLTSDSDLDPRQQSKRAGVNWDLVFKVTMAVSMFFVGYATLWMNNEYVRTASFDAYRKEQSLAYLQSAKDSTEIREAIIRIQEKLENDKRQDIVLQDHEQRIRVVERKP